VRQPCAQDSLSLQNFPTPEWRFCRVPHPSAPPQTGVPRSSPVLAGAGQLTVCSLMPSESFLSAHVFCVSRETRSPHVLFDSRQWGRRLSVMSGICERDRSLQKSRNSWTARPSQNRARTGHPRSKGLSTTGVCLAGPPTKARYATFLDLAGRCRHRTIS
jgi:hypothetical protein